MLSSISNRLIPEFVRENHPDFEAFLKAWLEYLDNGTNGPHDQINNLGEYVAPDESVYIDTLKETYMVSYPKIPLGEVEKTDDAFLIKHMRDVYKQKGSEAAFKFFFQEQFGVDITFNYPKEKILRTSDGKWQLYRYIMIEFSAEDIDEIIGRFFNRQIVGRTSGATAFVNIPEGVDPTYWINKEELPLKDIQGDFIAGEIVEVVT
jgi:hypothetical protein